MKEKFSIKIDGTMRDITADPEMPLLYALRGALELKGPKFGCGLAQCGACTVLMDNQPIRSCVTPVSAVDGDIRTLDGLGTEEKPHPVQAAFMAEEVPQCGYCTNGWMMYTVALLERNPDATDQDIRDEFVGLKCRCATHMSIMRAVKRAAKEMRT
ncbi:Nicotinate dehydrogenase subunit A [Hartmannibacter diazotrophicus]|uniref:Nicotinate dehydrogenase subunit A n=1 Tax=Hartmannibacter diazotrophicus TaxID=1482074 RepID=A0A2C9DBZ1_9HYPH|nr:(2Fe-2S)-binding protein [Hartmannibacter diazotrophicus]SON57689.1 Nicotinate dehydrogenase subunit A [Hartmannibacter diazotrophicus]